MFFVLRELLGDYGAWSLVILGAVAIAVMVRAPEGLWGLIGARFDLRLFPVQRPRAVCWRGGPAGPAPASSHGPAPWRLKT